MNYSKCRTAIILEYLPFLWIRDLGTGWLDGSSVWCGLGWLHQNTCRPMGSGGSRMASLMSGTLVKMVLRFTSPAPHHLSMWSQSLSLSVSNLSSRVVQLLTQQLGAAVDGDKAAKPLKARWDLVPMQHHFSHTLLLESEASPDSINGRPHLLMVHVSKTCSHFIHSNFDQSRYW